MSRLYLGSVVEDGHLRWISPSQMDKFDDSRREGCERRWWFRYVGRVEEPDTEPQKLGQQVHAQIEHYLRTGEDVLGELARAGRRFLPRPGPDLRLEWGFATGDVDDCVSLVTAAGLPVSGHADLAHSRGEWVDDEETTHYASGEVEVVDWKTIGAINDDVDPETGVVRRRSWAKTADQIAREWPMLAYGHAIVAVTPGATSVRLGYGYFQKSGPRAAEKRSSSISVAELAARWDRADVLVERMRSVARQGRIEDVRPNYAACGAFGGCPHQKVCPRDPKQVLLAVGRRADGGHMGLLDKRRAAADAATETTKTTALAHAPSEVQQEIAKLEAEDAAFVETGRIDPEVDEVELFSSGSMSKKQEAELASRAGATTFAKVGAPDAPKPTAAFEPPAAPSEVAAPAAPGEPCPHSRTQVKLTDEEVASKVRACPCGARVKVKPMKLGDGASYAFVAGHVAGEAAAEVPKSRRPKAEKASTEVPSESVKAPAEVSKTTGYGKAGSGLDLYLDAVEDGVAFAGRLENYAAAKAAELAAEFGAADIRCAPADGPLGFSKYKGALAAAVKADPPPPGAWAVSSSSELGMIAFETLASKAWKVVRGVK